MPCRSLPYSKTSHDQLLTPPIILSNWLILDALSSSFLGSQRLRVFSLFHPRRPQDAPLKIIKVVGPGQLRHRRALSFLVTCIEQQFWLVCLVLFFWCFFFQKRFNSLDFQRRFNSLCHYSFVSPLIYKTCKYFKYLFLISLVY